MSDVQNNIVLVHTHMLKVTFWTAKFITKINSWNGDDNDIKIPFMCQNWIETKRPNAPKPDPFTHKKSNIMLHLFQQTSRYNKSVVQTRYKKERKTLIRIRKLNTLEPKPGTYNTDINYLRCLELKQTKLNLTQEIQIIYYTIPVNFFC